MNWYVQVQESATLEDTFAFERRNIISAALHNSGTYLLDLYHGLVWANQLYPLSLSPSLSISLFSSFLFSLSLSLSLSSSSLSVLPSPVLLLLLLVLFSFFFYFNEL
jgi:hypothetical protein